MNSKHNLYLSYGWSAILLVIIAIALSSCLSLRPETPREKLLAVEYGYLAALNTTEQLVDAGHIQGEEAIKATQLISTASAAIGAARLALNSGDPNMVELIDYANQQLLNLTKYLETQNGP